MAKQLNVNMAFTADTTQAKKRIQELQSSLSRLMGSTKKELGIEGEIKDAIKAATELSVHLKKAVNIDTGNLDFAKLNQSIKASGKNLSEYGRHLQSLGPQGQQAFMQLTSAIAQSEIPMRRTNALVKEFATTLANTARWQLSSSVLHGFMGAVQSAYGYAQDLNESLNNIRIVTGLGTEDMAKFAKEANKAAKALSTTTTEYTNASLIYYQQGLNADEVKKRTDITIKLANVSRQSAEEVSEQMTAIWNNFYDGSKSLEYYADVLTALGAATASSTEEISGGLEKFAAIAETIGLSYEYAAAALATLTSNTRESEEVVGTALKTIFARIQGLNLGETLDDGTTLNKYSTALASVGINIKTTTGELKDMDVILNEMGSKWDNLSRAQQTALAQTVAGTRQYNQLMALMANWNSGDGDSFVANLATAQGAEGTLQSQADIYAEGWEAAADRVSAAAETIYTELINDEFFVDLLNAVEKVLEFIDTIIDRMGGLSGVLSTLGMVITNVFSKQLSQGLQSMAYNMQMMTVAGRKKVEEERESFLKSAARDMADSVTDKGGGASSVAADVYTEQLTKQRALLEASERMSAIEKETVQMLMDQLKLRGELVIKKAKERDVAEATIESSKERVYQESKSFAQKKHKKFDSEQLNAQLALVTESATTTSTVSALLAQAKAEGKITTKQIEKIKQVYIDLQATAEAADKDSTLYNADDRRALSNMLTQLSKLTDDTQAFNFELAKVQERINGLDTATLDAVQEATGANLETIQNYSAAVRDEAQAGQELSKAQEDVAETSENVTKAIEKAAGEQHTWADAMVGIAGTLSGIASAWNMIGSAIDTINDPNLEPWEKFTQIMTTLPMLITTVMGTISTLGKAIGVDEKTTWKAALAKLFKAKASDEAAESAKGEQDAIEGTTQAQQEETRVDVEAGAVDSAQNEPPKFGPNGRQFGGKYDRNGNPLDTKGRRIGKNDFEAAGLDADGKPPAEMDTPKGIKGIAKGLNKPKGGGKLPIEGTPSVKGGAGAGIGAWIGAIAAAAAIVIVAVGTISLLNDALNANSIAAEKAEKASIKMQEAYAEAKNEYSDLMNTISSYENAKDSIKDMVKGTAEFTAAIVEANEEALKLIETYDNVNYTTDENGIIQIDEASMERIKKEQADEMTAAQRAAMTAKQQARDAKTKASMTEFNRDKIKTAEGMTGEDGQRIGIWSAAAGGAGAVGGLAVGAAIGSAVPIVGTLIGAGIGLLAGAVTGAIVEGFSENSETEEETEAVKLIAEYYQKNGEEGMEEGLAKVAETNSELAQQLRENKSELRELCQEMARNTAARRAENITAVNQILENNDTVQKSIHKEDVSAFVADAYGAQKDAKYEEYMSEKARGGWFGFGTETQASNWQRYAESVGIDDLNGYKQKYYKGDGSVVYEYIDENGDVQEKTVTQEEMAAKLAEMDAAEVANQKGTEIATALNAANLTREQVKMLSGTKNKDMSQATLGSLNNVTQYDSGLLATLGLTQSEINAQAAAQLADIQKAANAQGSSVGNAISSLMTADFTSNISQGAMKKYAETLSKVNSLNGTREGTSTFEDFQAMLNAQIKNNTGKADSIMQIANNIDWSKGESAMQEFNYQLLQVGVNIDENSTEWKNFAKSMQDTNVSVLLNDLNSVRAALTDIKSLTKNIKLGSVISDEDYDKLIKYNAALADQFAMTADGYMYIGGDGLNITDDYIQNQLQDLKDNNKRAKSGADAMSKLTAVVGGESKLLNWDVLAGGTADEETLKAAVNALINSDASLDALGVSATSVSDLLGVLNSSDPDAKREAREKLIALFSDAKTIQNNNASGMYEDKRAEEVIASQMTYDELLANEAGIDESIIKNFLAIKQKARDETELEEAERYHAINEELERTQKLLSTINKLKTNASEKERIKLLQKESELLKQQVYNQSSYLDEVKANLVTDSDALKKYGLKTENGKITNYNDIYQAQLEAYQEAQRDYNADGDEEAFKKAEKIWKDFNDAVKQYEDTYGTYQDAQNAVIDANNQFYNSLVTAYTDTLSIADEAFEKYATKMDHHNKLLEHQQNLLSLIGKEKDYAAIGKILEGQAQLAQNNLKVSRAQKAIYDDEVASIKAQMETVQEGSDAWNTYADQLEAVETRARETEDQMLADLQSWAESEKSILENTLAGLGKTLEETLTGGTTFDQLNTQMERAQSLQEEYLTTTNKIYETTKMMRTAQQAIDQSTNAVAKEKLKGFINETKSLQEQGKLSQYELDMQQAKYDLLVAEIALEEAQNAKSTVRLQRDSEGNFGYVYTADAGAVADAQQKFDDAENALYNKGLEGANNYAQKYQQTMSEMTSTLQEIQTNYLEGAYVSEEEYQTAMLEARKYYTEQLTTYSNLYGVATESNTNIINDAWSSSCDIMSTSIDTVNRAIDDYMEGASAAFTQWQEVVSTVEQTTGKDLESIASHVNTVTTASNELTKTLLGENGEGGLISELKSGFAAVADAIQKSLEGWNGVTVTVKDDGTWTIDTSNLKDTDVQQDGAATGGLTTNWGPEGKMLMVHENELILNSDQTNKFFENLALMENILATIDSYIIGQQLGGILSSPAYTGSSSGTLEQNVRIEANFPSVTDRNEIEEAFNNLVNKASQYANR